MKLMSVNLSARCWNVSDPDETSLWFGGKTTVLNSAACTRNGPETF